VPDQRPTWPTPPWIRVLSFRRWVTCAVDSTNAFALTVLLIHEYAAAKLAHMGSQHRSDSLDILHRYFKDEATNLIHIEPPFNSIQNSNTFFHEGGCTEAADKLLEVRP
jgi:hypothetical protein